MVIANLGAALALLFPAARPTIDYRVYDDGSGPKLTEWDEKALGPRPTDDAIATASLDAAKGESCGRIDARTDAIISRGFTFDGHTFDLDAVAMQHLTALYAFRANLTFPLDFTTRADGAYTVADIAGLTGLCGTALATAKTVIDSGRALKVAVVASQDAATVAAVVDPR